MEENKEIAHINNGVVELNAALAVSMNGIHCIRPNNIITQFQSLQTQASLHCHEHVAEGTCIHRPGNGKRP